MIREPRYRAAFAIVRIDLPLTPESEVHNRIVIKRIVWDADVAEAEVRRLNELGATKNCRYFWQYTRVDIPPEGSEEERDATSTSGHQEMTDK